MTEYAQEGQTEHTNTRESHMQIYLGLVGLHYRPTRSLSHSFHWAFKTYQKLNITESKLGNLRLSDIRNTMILITFLYIYDNNIPTVIRPTY